MKKNVQTAVAISVAACGSAWAAGPVGPNITHGPVAVELKTLATGLAAPDDMIPVPGNANQNMVLDQTGKVLLMDHGVVQSTPFMDLTSRIVPLTPGYDERGLLGLAFDPNYNGTPGTPGYHTVYTYTSESVSGPATFTVPVAPGTVMNCQNVIAAWNTDTNTRREILRIDKPQFNHNGGTIAFGPDGDLYLGTGDGGAANDVGTGHTATIGNAQDLTVALGKMLRIDVRGNNSANGQYGIPADNPFQGAGQVKEIYAYGLRNPFRFSVDTATGKMIIGDVGQNNIEEIDLLAKGANFGWHLREGNHDFDPVTGNVSAAATPTPAGLTDPVAEYDHVNGGIAVIGGFVYHGSLIPQLQGEYVFGDFSTSFGAAAGKLFYMDITGPNAGQIHDLEIGGGDRLLGLYLKGFGQDGAGEIYVLGSRTLGPTGTTGVVLELTTVPEPGTFALGMLGAAMMLTRRRRRIA